MRKIGKTIKKNHQVTIFSGEKKKTNKQISENK